MRARITVVALTLAAFGCGGTEEGPGTDPPPPPPWENVAPELIVASPGEMAVGDQMTILGEDFIDSVHGRLLLSFKGTFYAEDGSTHAVDYQSTDLQRVNSGKLRWELWPNIIFHPNGDQLGRFIGEVTLTNQGNDGSAMTSAGLPVAIDIAPSIIPRMVRPTVGGCASMVQDTLEETPMAFTAEVVGLRPATSEAPLTFYWTFLAEQWKVAFNHGTLDPGTVVPETGALMLTDQVTSGRASVVQDGGDRNFMLKIAEDLVGSTRLKELKTGALPEGGNNMPVTVNVAVVDAAGKSAKLTIKLTIHKMADMIYDGTTKVAERFPPVQVTDCIPGGDIGREVSYSETTSESRSRSMGFNYNANVGVNLGLPSNPFALGVNFSAGFGVNINEQVSSDKSEALNISGHVLPGEYAVFYRQTTKVLRVAQLVGWTTCGQSVNLGEAILTDWLYTPDLAKGMSCVPESNLPPAEKLQ